MFHISKGEKMSHYIGRFEKVSFEQFKRDFLNLFPETSEAEVLSTYEKIELPQRSTKGSAGYDFGLTLDIEVAPRQTVMVPTGIRVFIEEGWFLGLFPRSGLGFKYRFQLNNTVGIVDADYYEADNEGHIFAKMANDSNEEKTLVLKEGDKFLQGIFMPFGLAVEEEVTHLRHGGLGSTSK